MPDTVKRYAIQMAPGEYSNGPQRRPRPLSKAKLWTNKGHLRNHLNGLPSKAYPKGATIVEVEMVLHESTIATVQDWLDEAAVKLERRRAESKIQSARNELHDARRRLEAAEREAKRKGII